MRLLSALALGAPLAAAIAFTDPATNATLTKGATFDLTWTSVDTDPSTFSVYLVNFVNWPPYYEQLALDLETSAGEASVRVPCDADSSYGFQFNAINGTNVYVIYAQTNKFFVSGDSCTDPATTSTAATCAAAATVTVTVRGNTTTSSSPSTTAFASSGAGAAVTTAAAKLAVSAGGGGGYNSSSSSTSTYEGECPSTIGWNGNYSHPVTLTEVPHAGRGLGAATGAPTAPTTVATATATAGAYQAAGTTTTTLMAVPTGGSKAVTGDNKSSSSSKCSSKKKRQVRKRHSDGGHPAPFPRRR